MTIYILDYGAGNVRSLANAINTLGYEFKWVQDPSDIIKADKLIFPGVGAFGTAMKGLRNKGYLDPLKIYLTSGKPYMGICVGMQCLFSGSVESPDIEGLNIIPAQVEKFNSISKSVPHMGWNMTESSRRLKDTQISKGYTIINDQNHSSSHPYYFVHSYAVPYNEEISDWTLSTTQYGDEIFISSIQKGNIFGTQFHPEKSGYAGLRLLRAFLSDNSPALLEIPEHIQPKLKEIDGLTKRIIACLDVRTNDQGDLVVTKGDQYNVREINDTKVLSAGTVREINDTKVLSSGTINDAKVLSSGTVRNLGKPAELSQRYFNEGADEITFLNITSFRNCPLNDQPLLSLLQFVSKSIFVPLTIGGGIKDLIDPDGTLRPAVEVAGAYFRSGADKVSIGSDAVEAALKWYKQGQPNGNNFKKETFSSIGSIAHTYGSQAVVISIDPKKVYINSPSNANGHYYIETKYPGSSGEQYVWYQCTVSGGRETRDLDVVQLSIACEAMGAGELLVNSIDKDGSNNGYDLELLNLIRKYVSIPVIASSGAGKSEHFDQVFTKTNVEAALAAGIFHRKEIGINEVKEYLSGKGWKIRALDNVL